MPLFRRATQESHELPGGVKHQGYTKRNADYWENRPSLARLILERVAEGGEIHQHELRDLADDAGYSRNSFYTTMSNLRSEGAIDQYGSTVSSGEASDYYNGDDGL